MADPKDTTEDKPQGEGTALPDIVEEDLEVPEQVGEELKGGQGCIDKCQISFTRWEPSGPPRR